MDNYYQLLEVCENSTQEEIKKAYKRLVFKFHPDISKEVDAHNKFVKLSEAYDIISDYEKRKLYDTLRNSNFKSNEMSSTYNKWKHSAQEKAKKDAETDFLVFKDNLVKKINETYAVTKKSTKLGCGLLYGLAIFGGSIIGIFRYFGYIVSLFNGEQDFSFWRLMSIFLLLIFSVIGYFLLKGVFENS